MSGKSLVLAIRIIGDATDAIRSMDEAAGKSDQFGNRLNTASKWAVAGLAAITAAAWDCSQSASEVQQSTGALESVFGTAASGMIKNAEAAADSIGLSEAAYGNLASTVGAQLKNMGMDLDAASTQTDSLMTLGADLAATFGGTTSEAVSALSSLLRGERDPIEKYGVSMKQADIDAQKAAMGLDGLTGEAAKNADLQATLALLTKQTADAQGQFAREADSAAGSAQIAAANFENAKAALGEALLPIITEASTKLSELAKWFQENAAWITPLIGVIAGLAAVVIILNAAYKAIAFVQAAQTAAQTAQTAAQWANNAAWLASPITWIIIAVIAAIAILITIIVLVIKHWDQIKAVAVAVWATIISWIQKAIDWLGEKLTTPITRALVFFTNLKNGAVAVFQSIIDWVRNAIDWIANLASNAVPGWAKDLLGMSRQSLMITPEVAAFAAPNYAATMAITPMVAEVPSYTENAPIATANLAAMTSLISALAAPTLRQSQPQIVEVQDNRSYEISIPNYLGDRRDLEAWLRGALKRIKIKDDRIVTV